MARPWRRFRTMIARLAADQGGNFAILFAASLPVLVIAAAFAVDEGALYLERRTLQSATDLAAIAAASDPANAERLARQALIDAGEIAAEMPAHALSGFQVSAGRYEGDPARVPSERFVAGAVPANAVHVRMARRGQLFFAAGWFDPPTLSVEAIASATPEAGLSVGSRLAALEGGLPNAILNGLLGLSVSADLVDYRALAQARVPSFRLLDALAGEVGLTAGTYGQVLESDIALTSLVRAMIAVLEGENARAASALLAMLPLIDGGMAVAGGRLLALDGLADLALGSSGGAGFAGTIDALGLLSAAAVLADGTRQIGLGLGAGVPGIAGLDLALAVGEPPHGAWYAIGPVGVRVATAQIRLRLVATVLGSGVLAGTGINVPLYVEIAPAVAEITGIDCSAGAGNPRVTISAQPGVARLVIASTAHAALGDFSSPAPLAQAELLNVVGLARVLASAGITIAQTAPHTLTFSAQEIETGVVKTVSTTTPVQSLAASLISDLTLDVRILGIGLLRSVISRAVRVAIAPLGPVLDAVLVGVLETLGLKIGQADIRVEGVVCRHAVLVQ